MTLLHMRLTRAFTSSICHITHHFEGLLSVSRNAIPLLEPVPTHAPALLSAYQVGFCKTVTQMSNLNEHFHCRGMHSKLCLATCQEDGNNMPAAPASR